MTHTWKQRVILFWRGWGWSVLIALLVATSFRSAIADWNDVPTGSMKPTILEGDRIFVNKLAYDLKVPFTTWHLAQWADPQRGDIVVFFSPEDGKRLVKRIVGLPGDTIAMWKNCLFLNKRQLDYEPLENDDFKEVPRDLPQQVLFFREHLVGKEHPIMLSPFRPSVNTFAPLMVPEGHYFMMGDNRDNSADSRFFGFVERERIVGRATSVVLSLDYGHHFWPRWNRFFSQLQ